MKTSFHFSRSLENKNKIKINCPKGQKGRNMNQEVQEGTVVGANVKLSGTISDNNDIIIHGTVEGEVVSEKNINISPSAKVSGPVKGSIITVAGEVEGDITGYDKTEVLPTAKINGSITTKELIIQSGAVFNGKCQMNEEAREVKKDIDQKKEKEEKSEKASAKEKKSEEKPEDFEPKEELNDSEPEIDDFELE
ncbi:MAG: hypothetical protein CEN89_106 [Candidatus Berkelbacteria bacterium Licking1014_7]|uniref:Integral membrane protein CcmA involved in cell shape determination n=1 Tax=Candidatus Berkelbacteria bacterium Licking1014_7 TaxID=2017147 RepID=A0A554LKN3_9BACT|nr:MAG: hypothetical protein CEN89_106 [Candidatus Berkelbacteria bacterium Licking1014_7]